MNEPIHPKNATLRVHQTNDPHSAYNLMFCSFDGNHVNLLVIVCRRIDCVRVILSRALIVRESAVAYHRAYYSFFQMSNLFALMGIPSSERLFAVCVCVCTRIFCSACKKVFLARHRLSRLLTNQSAPFAGIRIS